MRRFSLTLTQRVCASLWHSTNCPPFSFHVRTAANLNTKSVSRTREPGMRASLREGKMKEAIAFFHQFPNVKDGSLLIAECWRRECDIDEAFAVMDVLCDNSIKPDLPIFRSLLKACLKTERPERSLDVMRLMEKNLVFPDESCFGMLTASLERIGDVAIVQELASRLLQMWKSSRLIIKDRHPDIYANRLTQAFGRTQDIQQAHEAFRKRGPASSELFGAYVRVCLVCGSPEKALPLWDELVRKGLKVDSVCFSALCRACGETGDIKTTRKLLAAIQTKQLTFQASDLQCAQLIKGLCVRAMSDEEEEGVEPFGLMVEACEILDLMVQQGIPINNSHCYTALLKACSARPALSIGKKVHAHMVQHSPILQKDGVLSASLITMYVSCAELNTAEKVFEDTVLRGEVPTVEMWTALIQGMALFGQGMKALALLKEMELAGSVRPNEATFVTVLMACSHALRPDEALAVLAMMKEVYHLEPNSQHYTCVVDALGRSGRIDEAYRLMMETPALHEDSVVWQALLGSCRLHQNVNIGTIAADAVRRLNTKDTSNFVLLGNMLAEAGDHLGKQRQFDEMKRRGLKKIPGICWIEIDGRCHQFRAHERNHPAMPEVKAEIEKLKKELLDAGHVFDTTIVHHHDVQTDKEKEDSLCSHSEKLAIAFGLLNTPPGTPLLLTKNLRVCKDCHEATAKISKIRGRTIKMRDAKRFHIFQNGVCSCNNAW